MSDSESNDFPSAGAVIAAFGGIRPMASRLDVPVSTVQGWKQRDAVPDNRIEEIRAAAQADGIDLFAMTQDDNTTGREPPESDMKQNGDDVPDAAVAGGAESAPRPVAPSSENSESIAAEPSSSGDAGQTAGSGTFFIALLALVVAVASAGWLYWTQHQPTGGQDVSMRLDAIERDVINLNKPDATIASIRAEMSELRQKFAELAELSGSDSKGFEARLDDIARKVEGLAAASGDGDAFERIARDIEDIKTAASANIAAVSALRTGVDNTMSDLSSRLVAVENRSSSAEVAETRAVGLVVAAADVRQSLMRGRPYATSLATLRQLAGNDADYAPHLATLAVTADAGVPTADVLARRFDGLIDDILAAERADADAPWYRQALNRAASAVSVRRIGDAAEGETTDAIIARTEARLADGDLAGAVAEAETMSAAAAQVAKDWLAQVEAALAAERAIAEINARAIGALTRVRGS